MTSRTSAGDRGRLDALAGDVADHHQPAARPATASRRRSRRRRRRSSPVGTYSAAKPIPSTTGSAGGSSDCCRVCATCRRSAWIRALSIASAARRAMSSSTATSSESCRWCWCRPTASVPSRCPRATSGYGDAVHRRAERAPASRSGSPHAAAPGSSPGRSPRARCAVAGSIDSSAWLALDSRSRPHSSVVCTAHHAPAGAPPAAGSAPWSARRPATGPAVRSPRPGTSASSGGAGPRGAAGRSPGAARAGRPAAPPAAARTPTARRPAPANPGTAGCIASGTVSSSSPVRGVRP